MYFEPPQEYEEKRGLYENLKFDTFYPKNNEFS